MASDKECYSKFKNAGLISLLWRNRVARYKKTRTNTLDKDGSAIQLNNYLVNNLVNLFHPDKSTYSKHKEKFNFGLNNNRALIRLATAI